MYAESFTKEQMEMCEGSNGEEDSRRKPNCSSFSCPFSSRKSCDSSHWEGPKKQGVGSLLLGEKWTKVCVCAVCVCVCVLTVCLSQPKGVCL